MTLKVNLPGERQCMGLASFPLNTPVVNPRLLSTDLRPVPLRNVYDCTWSGVGESDLTPGPTDPKGVGVPKRVYVGKEGRSGGDWGSKF